MTLKRLRRLMGYKGAGVLFTAPDAKGYTCVLLGQRMYRPFAGHWSLPGGGMEESDGGSFRTCAAREAFEETVGIPKLRAIERVFEQRLSTAAEHPDWMPLCFEYRSYLLPLATMPDLRLWANAWSRDNEFRRFQWLRPDGLPNPLHPYLANML